MKHYGKILSVGDSSLKEYGLFDGEVEVEEKVDGSQFRFGVEQGAPFYGSKSVIYGDTNPVDKMFNKALETAQPIVEKMLAAEKSDWLAICEYLQRPTHNALSYERTPNKYLVLLDVWVEGSGWLPREQKAQVALEWGLEVVPILKKGVITTAEDVKELLQTESFLGKSKVEGIVIKNHSKKMAWGGKEQTVMGKFVREEFKELNHTKWKTGVPLEEQFEMVFPKKPRWDKVIQHLNEEGKLTNTPKDFALLMPELMKDFGMECKQPAMEFLWQHYKHALISQMTRGFIDYYKEKTLTQAFEVEKTV